MSSIDDRKESRRYHERRQNERRKITDVFGSDEWLAAVQKDYHMWPKTERRRKDRRYHERRHYNRRQHQVSQPRPIRLFSDAALLTEEEKQMLNALSRHDGVDEF